MSLKPINLECPMKISTILPSHIIHEQISESSQKVHQLFKYEPCFGEISTNENNGVSSQTEEI
jgi:hypothetical protein